MEIETVAVWFEMNHVCDVRQNFFYTSAKLFDNFSENNKNTNMTMANGALKKSSFIKMAHKISVLNTGGLCIYETLFCSSDLKLSMFVTNYYFVNKLEFR